MRFHSSQGSARAISSSRQSRLNVLAAATETPIKLNGASAAAAAAQQAKLTKVAGSSLGIWPPGSVCGVILGGGENDSRRLFPLTEKRTLPAIPVAGQFRLIDVPISNLINSGCSKIYVLTQYNSTSLNRYLTRTYNFGSGVQQRDCFVEVVANSQDPTSTRWAEGPADNVRQFMSMFQNNVKNRGIDEVMVLPSDQLYHTDFAKLVDYHRSHYADLTIVCRPCAESDVENMGILKVDKKANIRRFAEKPKTMDDKVAMSMDFDEMVDFMEGTGMDLKKAESSMDEAGRGWIGSCGMYVFRRETLVEVMDKYKKIKDFGHELIPQIIKDGYKVVAYNLEGYWEDIGGSILDFYNGNMKMLKDNPQFDNRSEGHPIFSAPVTLPSTVLTNCKIQGSLIGGGCTIDEAEIVRSIVGQRQNIGKGCVIRDSIIMGLDYYEQEKSFTRAISRSFPPMGIGAGTSITKAIIDKDARIGKDCKLENSEGIWESFDRIKSGICIKDGIIIVSKTAIVPDGTIV